MGNEAEREGLGRDCGGPFLEKDPFIAKILERWSCL